jgi:hypothetical protein
MSKQLKLTLIATGYERIEAASDLQPALTEMLRAYFKHMLPEEHAHDGEDHGES